MEQGMPHRRDHRRRGPPADDPARHAAVQAPQSPVGVPWSACAAGPGSANPFAPDSA